MFKEINNSKIQKLDELAANSWEESSPIMKKVNSICFRSTLILESDKNANESVFKIRLIS